MPSMLDIGCARARAKRVRPRTALAMMLAMAFFLSLAPFGIQAESDSTSGNELPYTLRLNLERSEAFADVAEPYDSAHPGAEYTYISALADAAGMDLNEFLMTYITTGSIGTGIKLIGNSYNKINGLVDGAASQAASVVTNLVDAADYPAWETLTDGQRQIWGSKINYDGAKANSLLRAFGLSGDFDPWYQEYYGSGGGNFEFSDDVKDTLSRLKNIGDRWSMGLGNKFEDLQSLVTEPTVIVQFPVGSVSDALVFDATDVQGWPNGFPRNFTVAYGQTLMVTNSSNTFVSRYDTDRPVYWLLEKRTEYLAGNDNYLIAVFDKDSFNFGISSRQDQAVINTQIVKDTTRNFASNWTGGRANVNFNMTFNYIQPIYTTASGLYKVIDYVLYGDETQTGESESIIDYPDSGPPPAQQIYYPSEGASGDTTYNNYTTPTTIIRQPTPYNPNDESSSNDWKNDTEANLVSLEQFPLNKLFPFSLLYDITILADKVKSVTVEQQVTGAYSVITIPINVPLLPGSPGSLQIDLSELHDLLLGTRIFIQILLATSLLFAAIRLWSGVLGGQ